MAHGYNVLSIQRTNRREGGREGGRGGRKKFYLKAELIKCIDPNEGEALKRGREGGEGRGRGAAENFTLGGRIDQMQRCQPLRFGRNHYDFSSKLRYYD